MGRGSCKPRLSAAEAAEAEAASYRPSQQAKEARMAELEERARLFGDSVKQSAQAQVLERKWLRFLTVLIQYAIYTLYSYSCT